MTDPFDTLGVEPRYELDLAAVERRHRDLSRALHPDRYTGAPAAERRLSLSRAIDVNEALRVLKDPVRRAEALLRRRGTHLAETGEPRPSPALLMEMMELREELADAGRAKDLARVHALAEGMRGRESAVRARLASAFDAAAGGANELVEILPLLGELRYIRRFLEEVSAIEDELAP